MINTFHSLQSSTPTSRCTSSVRWTCFPCIGTHNDLLFVDILCSNRENIRVFIDDVICPGLASDVRLGPRPPSSVVALGADDTLPYVI